MKSNMDVCTQHIYTFSRVLVSVLFSCHRQIFFTQELSHETILAYRTVISFHYDIRHKIYCNKYTKYGVYKSF